MASAVVVFILLVIMVAAGVTLAVVVHSGLFSRRTNRRPTLPAAVVIPSAVRTRPRATARPAADSGRLVVERDRRPLWEVRGWRRVGNRLVGAYRTPRRSFAGEIDVGRGFGTPDFYIVNPPASLLNGPHSACFRPRGGGRYWIHFSVSNRDVDSGIATVEFLLEAALR